MANACALCFESTRAHQSPDVEALRDAEHHAAIRVPAQLDDRNWRFARGYGFRALASLAPE